VPFFLQSLEIEALTAPFANNLPTIHPRCLKFPVELNPNMMEDLKTMANCISQLNYHPDHIRMHHEEESQKSALSIFADVDAEFR